MPARRRRPPANIGQATAAGTRRQGVKSLLATRMFEDLAAAPVVVRRAALRELAAGGPGELEVVAKESLRLTGTAYYLWHDTPSGFTEDIVGDTIWSKQREVLDAVVGWTRVAVPAGFGVGKTWLAGRLVGWAGSVNPPGSIVIVTTATRLRQVKNQLWPHIRSAHAKGGLPGWCDTLQWKQVTHLGNEERVAYGFTAPAKDEAAMQGIHGTPKLLLVVDEAGGISKTIGHGTNNLMTGDAHMLAIGNPAANDAASWFEELCLEGESEDEPETTTIRISTLDSPALTGEVTPVCRDCAYNPDRHTIARHLPNQDWLNRTYREYGDQDHPYIVAKVKALFPKDTGNQIIPSSWIERAMEVDEPDGEGWRTLNEMGLPGETGRWKVKTGAWVRLGVDVAADGGDEFVIYRCVGDLVQFRHSSVGVANKSQTELAAKVLAEIEAAQRLADALGSPRPVRVKVDKNGLGYGQVSMLETWAQKGRHKAEIVGVMVSENPEIDDPGASLRPRRKRDEMWLAMRQLLQPDPTTGDGMVRLRIDRQTKVQMSTPLMLHRSGFVEVESKSSMRSRNVKSPDRAEAAILSIYEPHPIRAKRRRGILN